ncbi:MAG: hypothetical protein DYH04_12580 [Nitrospira sp. NTP2]|nr:hypothetical protein [Nitrospira sp. NTP2]RIK61014.1 MAG: hypothetical protein DCC63_02355 [Nitrospira sp.]
MAFLIVGIGSLLCIPLVRAAESSGPWECSGYSGDAHTRCLQAFIEIQRDKISKLEAEVHAQQGAVGQLKDQVERQNAMTADLQRQMNERPAVAAPVTPYYAYPPLYSYPPVGFGLYLGRPWLYGSLSFGRPYAWGPRYYRPYYGRWHRRW